MASNFQMPAWLVHVLALAVGSIVYLGSNQEFLQAIPAGWVTVFHIAGPLMAYLGISQVSSNATANTTPAK